MTTGSELVPQNKKGNEIESQSNQPTGQINGKNIQTTNKEPIAQLSRTLDTALRNFKPQAPSASSTSSITPSRSYESKPESTLAEKPQEPNREKPVPEMQFEDESNDNEGSKKEETETKFGYPVYDVPLPFLLSFLLNNEEELDSPTNNARIQLVELFIERKLFSSTSLFEIRDQAKILSLAIADEEILQPLKVITAFLDQYPFLLYRQKREIVSLVSEEGVRFIFNQIHGSYHSSQEDENNWLGEIREQVHSFAKSLHTVLGIFENLTNKIERCLEEFEGAFCLPIDAISYIQMDHPEKKYWAIAKCLAFIRSRVRICAFRDETERTVYDDMIASTRQSSAVERLSAKMRFAPRYLFMRDDENRPPFVSSEFFGDRNLFLERWFEGIPQERLLQSLMPFFRKTFERFKQFPHGWYHFPDSLNLSHLLRISPTQQSYTEIGSDIREQSMRNAFAVTSLQPFFELALSSQLESSPVEYSSSQFLRLLAERLQKEGALEEIICRIPEWDDNQQCDFFLKHVSLERYVFPLKQLLQHFRTKYDRVAVDPGSNFTELTQKTFLDMSRLLDPQSQSPEETIILRLQQALIERGYAKEVDGKIVFGNIPDFVSFDQLFHILSSSEGIKQQFFSLFSKHIVNNVQEHMKHPHLDYLVPVLRFSDCQEAVRVGIDQGLMPREVAAFFQFPPEKSLIVFSRTVLDDEKNREAWLVNPFASRARIGKYDEIPHFGIGGQLDNIKDFFSSKRIFSGPYNERYLWFQNHPDGPIDYEMLKRQNKERMEEQKAVLRRQYKNVLEIISHGNPFTAKTEEEKHAWETWGSVVKPKLLKIEYDYDGEVKKILYQETNDHLPELPVATIYKEIVRPFIVAYVIKILTNQHDPIIIEGDAVSLEDPALLRYFIEGNGWTNVVTAASRAVAQLLHLLEEQDYKSTNLFMQDLVDLLQHASEVLRAYEKDLIVEPSTSTPMRKDSWQIGMLAQLQPGEASGNSAREMLVEPAIGDIIENEQPFDPDEIPVVRLRNGKTKFDQGYSDMMVAERNIRKINTEMQEQMDIGTMPKDPQKARIWVEQYLESFTINELEKMLKYLHESTQEKPSFIVQLRNLLTRFFRHKTPNVSNDAVLEIFSTVIERKKQKLKQPKDFSFEGDN